MTSHLAPRLPLLAALVAVLGCRPVVIAPTRVTGTCRPSDTYAMNLVAYMTELATATDDPEALAARRLYHLAPAKASAVSLVTDDRVCRQALAALGGVPATAGGRARVYVVRVGDAYVVADPDRKVGDSKGHLVLDRSFAMVARVGE
jgi:hypothetical protein